MIKHCLTLLSLLTVTCIQAQHVHWEENIPVAYYMDTDSQGNSCVLGEFSGQIVLSSDTFISNGLHDSYMARYSSSGNFLFGKHITSPGVVSSMFVRYDNEGNILTAFNCQDSSMLLPDGIPVNPGYHLMKFSPSGTLVWDKVIGKNGSVWSITTDESNNIYVGGRFQFDLFARDSLHTSGGTSGFLAKYTPQGDARWAREFEWFDYQPPQTVPIFASVAGISVKEGKILVVGHFTDTLITPVDTLSGSGSHKFDLFLCGLDTAGNFLWIKQTVGPKDEIIHASTNDVSGNLYITGFSTDEFYLDGQLVSSDFFFAAGIDLDGNLLWGTSLLNGVGSNGIITNYGIVVDSVGTSFIVGDFAGAVNFLGTVLNSQAQDVFVLAFDETGNLNGLMQGTSTGGDIALSISSDEQNSLYMLLGHDSNFTFGDLISSFSGGFILKFSPSMLSVESLTGFKPVRIYPNPAMTSVTIEGYGIKSGALILIYDSSGRIVKKEKASGSSTVIDISSLVPGNYILKVMDTGTVGKLIKW